MVRDVDGGRRRRPRVELRLTIVGCPAADRSSATCERPCSAWTAISEHRPRPRRHDRRGTRGPHRPAFAGTKTAQFGPDSLTKVYAISSGKGGVGKSTAHRESRGRARGARPAGRPRRRGRVRLLDSRHPRHRRREADPGRRHDPAAHRPRREGHLDRHVRRGVDGRVVARPAAAPHDAAVPDRRVSSATSTSCCSTCHPGTGDVAISLGQLLPHAEVLVVTTPQPAAAEVAERSGLVARQTGQTVIGVVENMAGLVQADGSVLELFGSGGGADLAARLSSDGATVPVLATIPLSVALRQGGDERRARRAVASRRPSRSRPILRLAEALAQRTRGPAGRQLPLQAERLADEGGTACGGTRYALGRTPKRRPSMSATARRHGSIAEGRLVQATLISRETSDRRYRGVQLVIGVFEIDDGVGAPRTIVYEHIFGPALARRWRPGRTVDAWVDPRDPDRIVHRTVATRTAKRRDPTIGDALRSAGELTSQCLRGRDGIRRARSRGPWRRSRPRNRDERDDFEHVSITDAVNLLAQANRTALSM